MALQFDGSTDYTEVDSWRVTGYPFTISCWYYASTSAQRMNPVCASNKNTANNDDVLMQLKGDVDPDRLFASIRSSGSITFNTGSIVYPTSQWSCAIYICSSSSFTYYIDGSSAATNTHSIAFPSAITTICVGARNNGGTRDGFMDGRVAEVGIWDGVALDASERASLEAGFAPNLVRPTELVNYWSLKRGLVCEVSGDTLGGGTPTQAVDHPPIFYADDPWTSIAAAAASPDTYEKYIERYEHTPQPNTLLRM